MQECHLNEFIELSYWPYILKFVLKKNLDEIFFIMSLLIYPHSSWAMHAVLSLRDVVWVSFLVRYVSRMCWVVDLSQMHFQLVWIGRFQHDWRNYGYILFWDWHDVTVSSYITYNPSCFVIELSEDHNILLLRNQLIVI